MTQKRPRLSLLVAWLIAALMVAGCGGGSTGSNTSGGRKDTGGTTPAPAFPTKPVEMVVAFAPGGSTDLAARLVAAELSKKWNQPVNVVNKAGASGATGFLEVMKAKPDGYTVLVNVISHATNPALDASLPYKWDDLDFVARINTSPLVLIVKGDSPYKTAKDLLDAMKKDPTKLKYGTPSKGGSSSFATVQIAEAAGVDPKQFTEVVLNGGAPTVAAVAGGHVDWAVQYLSEVIDLVKGGKLRALAVTTPERVSPLPDVPTGKEAGIPTLTYQGWIGVVVPKGTPKEVVEAWNKALKELLADKTFQQKLIEQGAVPGYLGPEEFKAAVEKDFNFARTVKQKLGL